jgi:hypothetical protein
MALDSTERWRSYHARENNSEFIKESKARISVGGRKN